MEISYIGEYLKNNHIITDKQLKRALETQKKGLEVGRRVRLGQLLVDMGYCTEEQVARALAHISGVPFISLNDLSIDKNAVGLLSAELAAQYQALPIRFNGQYLQVAMLNPSDVIAVDDLRILTGYDIEPVVIADSDLKAAIHNLSLSEVKGESNGRGEEYENIKSTAYSFLYGNSSMDVVDYDDMDIKQDMGSEKPAVQLANQIFVQAVHASASDIHIEPQEKDMRVRFRIDGVMQEAMRQPKEIHPSLVSRLKVMGNMDIAERRIPQDGRMSIKVDDKIIDVRVASLPTAYGEKLTMRLLERNSKLITLEELGFPKNQLGHYRDIIAFPYGFILVTGPTGSGKSTTLYSTLVELNSEDRNIITIEDPIERRLEGLNQIQVNTRAGMTFASGLRSILRSDPDIIMVGEIRDEETARIAVESALTGHLVLSTLHTNDAAGAVTRLNDMGIEPYLTASSLVGVVAQRLVRVLCPLCKSSYTLTRHEILNSVPDFPMGDDEDSINLYRPKGCLHCNYTGYKGRMGIFEVLRMTDEIEHLILNRGSAFEIKDRAIGCGMVPLRQDGLDKVRRGITSLEECLRVIV